MRCHLVSLAIIVAAVPPALAQSSYSGMQVRPIKALSDQQIADLKAGHGMGLALPAELNGYPGPSHVLELADRLGLSDDQRSAVRRQFEAMKAETIPIGEQLIGQEAALDALFAEHKATSKSVTDAAAEIGATQGKLRAAHLKYHLAMLDLLQPAQVKRYAELRGYRDGAPMHHHPGQ